MAKYAAASIVLSLSVGLCACATRHAEEPTDTELAYQARDANCYKVIDYKITQREPRNFTVGYQAKMVVGEFAAGDTFYVKYQGRLYIPKAARGLVVIRADYQSTIHWCEGRDIGSPIEED
jgi:hypothetical protein